MTFGAPLLSRRLKGSFLIRTNIELLHSVCSLKIFNSICETFAYVICLFKFYHNIVVCLHNVMFVYVSEYVYDISFNLSDCSESNSSMNSPIGGGPVVL